MIAPTLTPVRSQPAQRPPARSALVDPSHRHDLLKQAATIEQQARLAAEQGDLANSARLILEAMDCERRAGGLGPQVLQLIKPRA